MTTSSSLPFVFATAGHIDHGKTQLIKTLTGMDTDRLKEEKERGISIELGFAFVTFPDGTIADIIDVPGHERFIHTMVAGVTSIDAALVIIACDEGVMPQTQEHVDILSLLGIKNGIILLTKADLVREDERMEIKNKIKLFAQNTFLEKSPVIFTSSITGEGMEEAKRLMAQAAQSAAPYAMKGNFLLPVDRVFTMKGFGTIVTGTLRLGTVREGDPVEILPQGLKTLARGLQVHKGAVKEAFPGQRTAMNLSGIQKESVMRGSVIAKPDCYKPTICFDAEMKALPQLQKPLANRQRFHLHLGTMHALCRVILLEKENLLPGESSLVQIISEEPVVTYEGDRFILRTYSPMHTVAGGKVIVPHAARHKRNDAHALDTLKSLSAGDRPAVLMQKLLKTKYAVMRVAEIQRETGWTDEQWEQEKLSRPLVVLSRDAVMHKQWYDVLVASLKKTLEDFHSKYSQKIGMDFDALKNIFNFLRPDIFSLVLQSFHDAGIVRVRGAAVSLPSFKPVFSEAHLKFMEETERRLKLQRYTPSSRAEITQGEPEREKIVRFLVESRRLAKIGELLFHSDTLEEARSMLENYFQMHKEMDVQSAKNLFPVTRKYLIPLLEYFDSTGLTVRVGNKRILRKKTQS